MYIFFLLENNNVFNLWELCFKLIKMLKWERDIFCIIMGIKKKFLIFYGGVYIDMYF